MPDAPYILNLIINVLLFSQNISASLSSHLFNIYERILECQHLLTVNMFYCWRTAESCKGSRSRRDWLLAFLIEAEHLNRLLHK